MLGSRGDPEIRLAPSRSSSEGLLSERVRVQRKIQKDAKGREREKERERKRERGREREEEREGKRKRERDQPLQ